ncbi:hypothetical protein K469DRAFT_655867 [Zopfia rhizophila CBS 207.26]|uniref:Heterokaryon incompatibility domain-containing protein n=1 Tax=Zopfia rhizophila CBS 207.26 TaxID=1314779 RepID=A0A6A6EKD7_9PEZI|nr:hypothetical protein K469DRAFT_655867 [Zopfia rhizophila CBS 207.26]
MAERSTMPQATFHHRQLSSPRSIRLLALSPSPDFDASLEATLAEVDLDNSNYEAVSYVWGSRVGTEPFACDGKVLLITPNCESALRHLRLKDKRRTLWVDAICIDQEEGEISVKERNSQVALMGEIYAKASHTICWLGQGNEFTNELMQLLRQIGTCPSQRGLKKLLLFDKRLREQGHLDVDSSSLGYILCHPWHSRIWTVQGAVYSQDCSVVCGSTSVRWDDYSKAAKFLVFDNFIEQVDQQAHKSLVGIDVRNVLRDYIREVSSSPKIASTPEDDEDELDRRVVFLSSCLTDVNQFQATEPRDKIYGLHALYTSLGIPLSEVDYGKSIARVYEEAAVAMVCWSGTLKVLGDACRIHRDGSFPSWVPNWSDGNMKISTPSGNATAGSRISKSSLAALNPIQGELHIRGKIIGTVEAWTKHFTITSAFPTHSEQCDIPTFSEKATDLIGDEETLRLWIDKTRFFRQLYALLQTNPTYCDGSEPEDIAYDLFKQERYSEPDDIFAAWLDILQYPKSKFDLTFGKDLVEKWKPATGSGAKLWTEELTNCAVIMASLISNKVGDQGRAFDDSPDILEMINQFSTNLADKALILARLHLNDKMALGTSISSTKLGDLIVLLEGADWPIVLRRTHSRWSFIGPAFVAEIMDGETWSDESEKLGSMSNFVLA